VFRFPGRLKYQPRASPGFASSQRLGIALARMLETCARSRLQHAARRAVWDRCVWVAVLHTKPCKHFSLPYIFLWKKKKKEQGRNPFHPLLLFSRKPQILSSKPPSFLDGSRMLSNSTGDGKDRSLGMPAAGTHRSHSHADLYNMDFFCLCH